MVMNDRSVPTYPRMTYYTKLISNEDGAQILNYTSTKKENRIYYGKVNALKGGESEYIVVFDIWNNEPSFDAATPQTVCQNAINCHLTIDIPSNCRNLSPFLYARCITHNPQDEFEEVSMSKRTFNKIQGNASDELGTIIGTSDHAIIQTKIKLRPNSNVKEHQYQFTLNFEYNYE